MSKIKLCIIAIACMALFSGRTFAQKGTIVGVVDVENVAKQLKETEEADKVIRDMSKILNDSLVKLQEDFQKRVEQYQKQQGMMTQDQKTKEETSLKATQDQLVQLRQNMLDEIGKKRDELLTPIRAKVKEAIDAVAKEEGMNLVIEKSPTNSVVLYVEDKYDITFRVIDRIKRK